MSTNLNTQLSGARGLTGEGWAAIAGALGSAFLLARRIIFPKPPKPDHVSRAEFYAELQGLRDRLYSNHLALLEKLEANHQQLLTAVEAQATRVAALQLRFARLDECMRK